MDDVMSKMYLRSINEKQNIILEQLSAISIALAKHLDLPIEEEECEYTNDVEWISK